MKQSLIVREELTFKANAEKVWDLLINPEMTKQYMFGCEVLSDWKVGTPIVWQGKNEANRDVVYVKGEIMEVVPQRKVTFTMFDPNLGLDDIPENYVDLTYDILPQKTGCKLIITQGDFQGAENAEKRFEESLRGWKMVIPKMKEVLHEAPPGE
ncbi:Uncharacterized conserved protein YndB, AHSA1/START domain [Tangfeifania diversioriginum]|uniref:Uncharacterized conserved protein YndB, AHSA1/START domain n=1 Tax=Tangfeifania diversioriginum TaxID=1168035 RepID=A0A1M6DMF9_9BACT|nr:SRPBCC domain-containing protein [Tangfeifania diversioriginum]SHI74178.1 Uncharacterized conserved protein YndB, AHSA1/START domain [Tangfeifania diversioriginum]